MAKRVTGLYCLVAVAVGYWAPGGADIASWVAGDPWYARSLAYRFYGDALVTAFVVGAVLIGQPSLREIFGRNPAWRDMTAIVLTVVVTFLASGAVVTLTMVSLWHLLPEFVAWWLERSYPMVVYIASDGSIPILPNILRALGLVVITPILEETIFRGYLLHAWSRRWGIWTGLLFSSAVFGAIHLDTVAAMLTGVGFSLLYLRTQTLWAPIIAHAIYNGIVACWNVLDLARNQWQYDRPTIEGLQSDWWIGAMGLLVVAILVDQIMRRGLLGPLRLPPNAAKTS